MAGTRHIATTAYHPSADGQAERTNYTLEVALRYFVNESQDDWADTLRTIEALLNNAKSATTGKAPNELIYGKRVRLDLVACVSEATPEAADLGKRRQQAQEDATRAIAFAQKAMKTVYDRKHEQPRFEDGWAFLRLGDGYKVAGIPKRKIGPQRVGPFKITEVLSKGKAYRLDLPSHYGIHDVISVAHLEPLPVPGSDPYNRPVPNEGMTTVYAHDGAEEWELDSLVKKRLLGRGSNRTTQYLARWKGYGPEWDQWLEESELGNALDLIKDFEDKEARKGIAAKAVSDARRRNKRTTSRK
jgi:hypothetical protein